MKQRHHLPQKILFIGELKTFENFSQVYQLSQVRLVVKTYLQFYTF